MVIDHASITRIRDLNPVQRDILRIIYRRIKDVPQGVEWHSFDEIITYRHQRFRVRLTYRILNSIFQVAKFEQADEDSDFKKKFVHWSKGQRM